MTDQSTSISIPTERGWEDIREGVRRICDRFPNDYWVKLDHEAAYPTEFVTALTKAGYLGALIPEEYGGSGLPLSAACAVLETIHDSPCNAAACHAANVAGAPPTRISIVRPSTGPLPKSAASATVVICAVISCVQV